MFFHILLFILAHSIIYVELKDII